MGKLRFPFTLRLIFHGIQSAWTGFFVFIMGSIWLVPATPAERSALAATTGIERPEGLTEMRIARAMIHFAPNRAAQMMSDATDGETSPEFAGMLLRQIASGTPEAPAAATDAPPAVGDDIDGPKFIQTD